MRLEFHIQFDSDVIEAADFYDGKEPGLGSAFTRDVWEAVQSLKANPELWKTVYRDVRRVRLKRFKQYSIRYRFIEKTLTVRLLGVFHAKRHPNFGKGRG